MNKTYKIREGLIMEMPLKVIRRDEIAQHLINQLDESVAGKEVLEEYGQFVCWDFSAVYRLQHEELHVYYDDGVYTLYYYNCNGLRDYLKNVINRDLYVDK